MPLGCPDRPEVGSAYLTSWSRTMHTLPWRRDDKAEWRDRIKCEVERRQELDAWCGVPGTRMLFVPSGPGSSVGAYEASLLQVPFRLDDPAGPDSLPLLAPTPVAGATAEDFDEADEAEEAEEAPSAAPARSLGKLRARAADTRARTASYQQQREGQVVHTVDIDDFEAAPALQMSAVQVQQATEVEPQKSSRERDADQSTERASVEATEKVELEAQEKAEVGAHETLKAGSTDRKAEREARDEAKREREAKRAERNAQRKAEREARERATATDNVHVAIDGVGSHAPEEADLNAQEVAEEAAERAQLAEFEAKRKAVSVVQTNALQSHQEAEADVVKPERDSSQMVEQSTERAEVEAKEKVVLEAEGKAEVEAHGTLKAGSADRKAEREAREEAKREREAKRAERNAQRKAEREARERAAAAANAEPPTGRAPTRVHVPSPKAAGCYLRLHHGCPLHPISTVVWHRVIAATDFHQCESAKGRMDTFCGHSKTSFYTRGRGQRSAQ
ncbi:unnamed protein product [Prorocentrum cordatum]|uniref:Uncharacterized protein n=1 Tax=Prorocentrum cordatum TaxID=2364126 RepID=A0ABN9XLM8_9DINO|nr:unnamed protein product [Polarella glacialis]